VKEAICDEKLSTPSEVSIMGASSRSSSTETLFPIAECTSTSHASISDIVKGTRLFLLSNLISENFILIITKSILILFISYRR